MINSTLSTEEKIENKLFFPEIPVENKGLFVFVSGLQGSWRGTICQKT